MTRSRLHRAAVPLLLFGLVGGCATAPQPITRIVNGRLVVTRAVSPEAYEHVTRAYLYEEEERWQEAADEFQRVLPFDPDAAEVRAELAELFIRLGRRDDAADEVARSLAISPTVVGFLAQAHLAEARSETPHQPASDPIPSLEQAARLALADGDAEQIETTHLELADVQIGALDLPAALETVRRLVQAAPETQRGRVQLAALAWTMDARDEASGALKAALDDEPADVEARVLLAELQVAGGHDKEAKTSFTEAIDRADAPLEIALAFAGWLVLRGDLAEAQELTDRLNADVPDVDALEQAAALERTVKRPERALALAERARKMGASPGRVAIMTGASLAAKDDPTGALKSFRTVAKGDPLFFEASLRIAELLREKGKLDEAGRALDDAGKALEAAAAGAERTHKVELAFARSELEEKRGDSARAARVLDDALAENGTEGALGTRLVLERAAVDDRRGDWQRALTRTEEILAREPRNVEALNFAGFVAADHGQDLPRAIRRLQAAVALSPGAGGIVDSLGWAYFRAGDLPRADSFLEQAGRLEPADPEILGHLGDLYAQRHERERALMTYKRALSLSPSDRVARELGERIRTLDAKSAAGR
ncbi:MAG TPA: tetratricopeptide repeat protein [Polyangia bacterium]|nr:tetratricopeptide repeat protein [Polyangia bacterium]